MEKKIRHYRKHLWHPRRQLQRAQPNNQNPWKPTTQQGFGIRRVTLWVNEFGRRWTHAFPLTVLSLCCAHNKRSQSTTIMSQEGEQLDNMSEAADVNLDLNSLLCCSRSPIFVYFMIDYVSSLTLPFSVLLVFSGSVLISLSSFMSSFSVQRNSLNLKRFTLWRVMGAFVERWLIDDLTNWLTGSNCCLMYWLNDDFAVFGSMKSVKVIRATIEFHLLWNV